MLAIFFVAKLGDEKKLAGVGMGNSLLEMIGTGSFTGLNMALCTLAS
jgi:Na+-driven multidrug efflux pump